MKPLSKTHLREPNRGFALVITLSLMVLLTLLAVGLLTLSSIALRSSAQGSAIAVARSNARLAMIIALGRLQKAAGQDQRATAPADLAGDTGGFRLAAGKAPLNTKSVNNVINGLTSVQPGTRYWTGVWDTVTTAAPASLIYTKTPGATNVRWLISGNELGTSLPETFDPSSTVATVSTSGGVTDDTKAALLVGANTVGPPSSSNIDNFVAAPTVDIEIEGVGGKVRGRYAWWVGDEGVKARLNRVAQSGQDKATYGTLASGRGGWEVVGGMQNYPVPTSPGHKVLERVVTLPTGELVNGLSMTGQTLGPLFHAATTDSLGVLADSLQGGLRVDLTSSFSKTFPAPGATTFPNAPKTGTNLIPTSVARNLKGPKWDAVKNFYTFSKTVSTTNKLTVKAATTSGYDVAIAPIIVDLRVVLGARMISLGGTRCKLNPCAKLAVCLANPYPYPLEWDKDLELELIDDTPRTNGLDTAIYGTNQSQRYLGRGPKSKNFDGTFQSGGYEPAVFNNAVFVISKDTLPAGESKAYTVAGRFLRPVNDASVAKIPLKPFASSSPTNFELCVELDQPDPDPSNTSFDFANAKQLDVRESWTTSQPTAELRLAGGSTGNVLCRVERFEWDNAYHAKTKSQMNYQAVTNVKMPFPLKVYTNQLSLPGADYQNQLPGPEMMGTRCSTLRSFTDFNLRAARFGKLITSYNPPPYFFVEADDITVDLPPTYTTSSLPSQTGASFTRDMAVSPVPWGRSMTASDVKKTVLFSFPKQFVSLAQLQHADLTADDEGVSISQQPGNALGNSYATPFVKRKQTILARNNFSVTGVNTGVDGSSEKRAANYYDMSYLLNAAMWDTYYFSALDDYAEADYQQRDRVITVAFPPADANALQDPARAAAHLLVNGSFNVNCTNKDAWKALLAGTRFLNHPAGGENGDAMFPRSLEQPTASASPVTGIGADSFSGYRRLTAQQIDTVAEEMVKQVRQRGPFVSLSHFVNRALIDLSTRVPSSMMLSRSGALQAALDIGGANISPDGLKSAFGGKIVVKNDKLSLLADGNDPKADVLYPAGGDFPANQPNNGSRGSTYGGQELDGSNVWAPQSADLNVGACASILADRTMLTDTKLVPEQGFRSTGIPGWVTQADVLQAIGPVLAARSDTFRIRSYGEALSPDGKTVLAKAWCEAIVQRTPNYIDPANTPTQRDTSLTDKVLTPLNKRFGRRFEIVSFRWLSQNEI